VRFAEYRNIVVEPELGTDVEQVADEVMNKMAEKGWQVVCVCPYTRPGKLMVTFGREKGA
jgi:hypothetical protein